jgi:HEAT repeat protein
LPKVRFGVVVGLSGLRDRVAIETLIELTRDPHEGIRDWATHGLGQVGYSDSKAIRKALWARVDDPDAIVRAEALAGLAKRHVPGVTDAVGRELRKDDVVSLVVETAQDLADPQLLPALLDLRSRYSRGMPFGLDQIEDAIGRCTG